MAEAKTSPVRVALVGIGGYGHYYLETLLEADLPQPVQVAAVVEPFPENAPLSISLKQRGIPIFEDLAELWRSGISVELLVIASPIHWHVPQSCEALEKGCHVLCDKPLGAVVQEADRLIQTRDRTGLKVWIGYQWSFSEAVQALKAQIRSGRLGRPLRFKTLCLWPRDLAYYLRNDWAGRLRDREGRWILDSPANNAMAHFLHNMLYLLGEEVGISARPAEVTAEACRVFPIENYDSVACRILTTEGVELLFYASHAVPCSLGPRFALECEAAEVACAGSGEDILCRSRGQELNLGTPEADSQFKKLFQAVSGVGRCRPQSFGPADGQENGDTPGVRVLCGPEAARPQTVCINGIQDSLGEVKDLTSSPKRRESSGNFWIEGLAEAFCSAFDSGILPSEAGFEELERGKRVDLRDYRFYPGGSPPEGSFL